MTRRKECPWPDSPDAWVDLPDSWFGEHARRRDEAVSAAKEKGLGATFTDLAVALAILDDWNLPGLNGNPEKWNFDDISLELIAWVNAITLLDFMKCWAIPKNSYAPSPNGLTEPEPTNEAPGLSEGV